MNGRKLFREFAQSKGKEAKSFVEIGKGYFGDMDTLITKDNKGEKETMSIDYRDMVHWIIRTKK